MKRFEYNVTEAQRDARCAMEAKWLVAGQTASDREAIRVTVEHLPGAAEDVIAAAFGHERGHSGQFADDPDFAPSKMDSPTYFAMEVDAWQRWVEDRAVQLDVTRGQLVLDCLNTYRRSLSIDDEQWLDARQLVEDWAVDDAVDELREYEPLEPEPGDEPACAPARYVVPVAAEPYERPEHDDDRTRHDEPPAEPDDDEQGDDGPERDWDEDPSLPDPRIEMLPDVKKEYERWRARDAWLATAEGQRCSRKGPRYLEACLRRRDWDGNNLPPLTQALLTQALAENPEQIWNGKPWKNKNGEPI